MSEESVIEKYREVINHFRAYVPKLTVKMAEFAHYNGTDDQLYHEMQRYLDAMLDLIKEYDETVQVRTECEINRLKLEYLETMNSILKKDDN